MREMLLGAARSGAFEPFWSERILGEWERAAVKLGPTGAMQASGEIALLKSDWPKASVSIPQALEKRLWLPDANDVHVLAAAIACSADVIITMNAKDFPRGILAEEGVNRVDPDAFLFQIYQANPETMADVGSAVLAEARHLSGEDWQMRALMKKARLPRLGKALA